MHTTMSNSIYKKDWKIYLKCKECWEYKELWKDNRYCHPEWFLWVLWRCKDCIKKGRRSEKEREMSRKVDLKRYYNENWKRKKWMKQWTKEYAKRDYVKEKKKELDRKREKEMWYWKIHTKTNRWIKKLWIRPLICPICKNEKRTVAHHPDYSKRNEIVFCCDECHKWIHSWKIKKYNIQNLFLIKL